MKGVSSEGKYSFFTFWKEHDSMFDCLDLLSLLSCISVCIALGFAIAILLVAQVNVGLTGWLEL